MESFQTRGARRACGASVKERRGLERAGFYVRVSCYMVRIPDWMDQIETARRRAVMSASAKRTRALARAAGESQLPQAPAM